MPVNKSDSFGGLQKISSLMEDAIRVKVQGFYA